MATHTDASLAFFDADMEAALDAFDDASLDEAEDIPLDPHGGGIPPRIG